MRTCEHCHGELYRVHRTLVQRVAFRAVYQCKKCGQKETVPRRFLYRFGPFARCPRCGNPRLAQLRERDRIDKMAVGVINLYERLRGGRIFYCNLCRLQFYDHRDLGDKPHRDSALPGAY